MITGFIFPPKPLSANTAERRIDNLNSSKDLKITISDDPYLSELLAKEDKDLGEWVYVVKNYKDEEYFKDQTLKVSGFILPGKEYSEEFFYITRFVVTCCAVDATPVGLLVQYDWMQDFSTDDWVEIEGRIELNFINENDKTDPYVVIYPNSITNIEIPEKPYLV